jgi:hypothetical protein
MRIAANLKASSPVVVSGVLAACLPGGEKGQDLTAAQAPAFFRANGDTMRTIVALVDECRPVAKGGDNTVWRDAEASSLRCATGKDASIAKLLAQLKSSDAAAVAYYAADGSGSHEPLKPLKSVSIIMATSGLGVSGSMTQISYSVEPRIAPVAEERREDGSLLRQERALTTSPFHWFWEQTN